MGDWVVQTKNAPAATNDDGWVVAHKGDVMNLVPSSKGADVLAVGLGWDPAPSTPAIDLDVCMTLLDEHGKCRHKSDLVFYNHKEHASGAVIHMGDNRTGAGEGDDEVMLIRLAKMPSYVRRIPVVVCIYDANKRNQTLARVKSAYVRLYVPGDRHHGKVQPKQHLLHFDLSLSQLSDKQATGAVFCEFRRDSATGPWSFHASSEFFRANRFSDFLIPRGWWM